MVHTLPTILLFLVVSYFLRATEAFFYSLPYDDKSTVFPTFQRTTIVPSWNNFHQITPNILRHQHHFKRRPELALYQKSNIHLDGTNDEMMNETNDAAPEKMTNMTSQNNSKIKNNDDEKQNTPPQTMDSLDLSAVCKVVANGDGKLPNFRSLSHLKDKPQTLSLYEQLDAYYHAKTHKETSRTKYLQRRNYIMNSEKTNLKDQEYISNDIYNDQLENEIYQNEMTFDYEEEQELVSTLKESLESAGFELLSLRDFDLCQALNVGYLLRLSIVPKIRNLDPLIGEEFFPDRVASMSNDQYEYDDFYEKDEDDESGNLDPLLFDGRVLVFRRGYSEEVSRGRLLLPKLDYLQTSLVQKSAAAVSDAISAIQMSISSKVTKSSESFKKSSRESLYKAADSITKKKMSNYLQKSLKYDDEKNNKKKKRRKKKKIQLARYGGSRIQFVGTSDFGDALEPFLLCEINDSNPVMESSNNENSIEESMTNSSEILLPLSSLDENVSIENKILYAGLESGAVGCNYDTNSIQPSSEKNSYHLLERVSISNIVDFFSKEGRQRLIKSFISKSELVEPTYEEVVVIWRPLQATKPKRPKFKIPNAVYDVAEIFEIEDRLPPKTLEPEEPPPQPIQIRIFNEVPMANLPAVLPETQLIFRPADAFLFDMVSVLTLLAVLATQRYDNPKLDLIALISVGLWLLRTVLRYSNKLARYDLLVNKFLTSKLSLKGAGALNYLLSEASKQRATRVGLLHSWLENAKNGFSNKNDEISLETVNMSANAGINELLHGDYSTDVNIDEAMNDLEELNLIESANNGTNIQTIYSGKEAMEKLKGKWVSLFDADNLDEFVVAEDMDVETNRSEENTGDTEAQLPLDTMKENNN